MHKIIFTLQVLGIIAMLPVYGALEINHGSTKPAEASIEVSIQDSPNVSPASGVRKSTALLLTKSIHPKAKQKPENSSCKCIHCNCGSNCMCN